MKTLLLLFLPPINSLVSPRPLEQRLFFSSSCLVLGPTTFIDHHRQSQPRNSATKLFFFDSLFGGSSEKGGEDDGVLASYPKFPAKQYDGLAEYIRSWATTTLQEKGSLTTPVKILTNEQGVQILFQPKKSTYKSKNEERQQEQGETGGSPSKKDKPKKDGGVEIVVLPSANDDDSNGELQVVARRCEMDEDTMIREMSEQAILDGLKKAITVWKKDHPN